MPVDFSRVKALCFDVDGTLSDTDDQMVEKISRRLNIVRWLFSQRNPRPFARWFVMGLETPGNLVFSTLDWMHLDEPLDHLASALARRGWGRRPPTFLLMPGVKPMLATLAARYPLAVVSARNQAATYAFINQFHLNGLFHTIVSAHTCEHTKPFPHPILWAAQQMAVKADECLMIGDTPVDIRAGKKAGAQTIAVLCGFGEEKELRQAGADLILNHTTDLLEILSHPTEQMEAQQVQP
jgi:phosphoglycolate phosphatase-like HAD superfamily hydrolase